jgi:hypothetical protein
MSEVGDARWDLAVETFSLKVQCSDATRAALPPAARDAICQRQKSNEPLLQVDKTPVLLDWSKWDLTQSRTSLSVASAIVTHGARRRIKAMRESTRQIACEGMAEMAGSL